MPIRDYRQVQRIRGEWTTELFLRQGLTEATCVDISQLGARFGCTADIQVGEVFPVTIKTDDHGDLAALAEVKWQREHEFGVGFVSVGATSAPRLCKLVSTPRTQTTTWRPLSWRILDTLGRLIAAVLELPHSERLNTGAR